MYIPASAVFTWLEEHYQLRISIFMTYMFGQSPWAAACLQMLQSVMAVALGVLQPVWNLLAVTFTPFFWLLSTVYRALRVLLLPLTWMLGGLGVQLVDAGAQFSSHLGKGLGRLLMPLVGFFWWLLVLLANAVVSSAMVLLAVLKGPIQMFVLLRTSLVQVVVLPWHYFHAFSTALRYVWGTVYASSKVVKSAAPVVSSSAKVIGRNWFYMPLTFEAVEFISASATRIIRPVRAVVNFLITLACHVNKHRRSLILECTRRVRDAQGRLVQTQMGSAAARIGNALLKVYSLATIFASTATADKQAADAPPEQAQEAESEEETASASAYGVDGVAQPSQLRPVNGAKHNLEQQRRGSYARLRLDGDAYFHGPSSQGAGPDRGLRRTVSGLGPSGGANNGGSNRLPGRHLASAPTSPAQPQYPPPGLRHSSENFGRAMPALELEGQQQQSASGRRAGGQAAPCTSAAAAAQRHAVRPSVPIPHAGVADLPESSCKKAYQPALANDTVPASAGFSGKDVPAHVSAIGGAQTCSTADSLPMDRIAAPPQDGPQEDRTDKAASRDDSLAGSTRQTPAPLFSNGNGHSVMLETGSSRDMAPLLPQLSVEPVMARSCGEPSSSIDQDVSLACKLPSSKPSAALQHCEPTQASTLQELQLQDVSVVDHNYCRDAGRGISGAAPSPAASCVEKVDGENVVEGNAALDGCTVLPDASVACKSNNVAQSSASRASRHSQQLSRTSDGESEILPGGVMSNAACSTTCLSRPGSAEEFPDTSELWHSTQALPGHRSLSVAENCSSDCSYAVDTIAKVAPAALEVDLSKPSSSSNGNGMQAAGSVVASGMGASRRSSDSQQLPLVCPFPGSQDGPDHAPPHKERPTEAACRHTAHDGCTLAFVADATGKASLPGLENNGLEEQAAASAAGSIGPPSKEHASMAQKPSRSAKRKQKKRR